MRLVLLSAAGAFGIALFGLPVTGALAGGDPVLVGAGDISTCSASGDSKTASLIANISGTVFTAGDNAYPDGTLAQFRDCYGPTWGQFESRTRPSAGNHDYGTLGATGYFTYFGSEAGDPKEGYYAYTLGSWRIYVLNSNCWAVGGCHGTSPQARWLKADLAANPRRCVLAYWHHPRFSSGAHGNDTQVAGFWEALYAARADVVISGHDHDYERFRKLTPNGSRSPRGIRSFVVGTGGAELRPFATIRANSLVRNSTTFGVLKLTLRRGSYDWRFIPQAGKTFTDVGRGSLALTDRLVRKLR